MTDLELFALMRPIIMAATGIPELIIADSNIQAPSGSYGAMRMTQSAENKGQAIVYRKDSGTLDITEDVRAQIIAEVSIEFYRDGALQFARKLKQANKRSNISTQLFLAKIGWNRTGPVNNLTALQADRSEQRAQISVFILYEEFDTDGSGVETINAIKKIPYAITDVNNNDLASGTIE